MHAVLRVPFSIFLAALLALLASGPGSSPRAAASVLEPASTGGVAVVGDALERLAVHRRMLMIGAHPDDEDNALLTYVSRELAGEVAYLSLSRGEGGQNLIGRELGEALGVLRTGELLAAREIERGRQYFTRAFDFGYSKSLEETHEQWPVEALREDVDRIVERFKPQIVVSIFPGDGRGRHGQHTAAGVVANELFDASVARTTTSWRPTALFRRPWWNPESSDFEISLGGIDPSTGRSLRQVAAESRSRHRSQDMGRLQSLGDRAAGLERVVGPDGGGLFAGIDTRLEAIGDLLDAEELRSAIVDELRSVRERAESAHDRLPFRDPAAVLDDLLAIHRSLASAAERLEGRSGAGVDAVRDLLAEKRELAARALLASAGIALDAYADREALVAGSSATLIVELWSPSGRDLGEVSAEIVSGKGIEWTAIDDVDETGTAGWWRGEWSGAIGPSAEWSLPYYLHAPRNGALYDSTAAPDELRGEAASPPAVVARVAFAVQGEELVVEREVVYRDVDQAIGEIRRPLRVVPRLEVSLSPEIVVVPRGDARAVPISVQVESNSSAPVAGVVEVAAPEGWRVRGERAFEILDAGGRTTLELALEPAAELATGRHEVRASAVERAPESGGAVYRARYPLIDYPHVRPTPYRIEARSTVSVVDLALPAVGPIGYVRGAADRVPESLERIGLTVEILDGRALAEGDLDRYDAIVVGPRAYEIDGALRAANPRLMRYVRNGGLLVVQYQQYQFVDGSYSPYPLSIARPHGRVTIEGAPVRALDPGHPVLTHPNRIEPSDWEGWVQERGLYFASEWGDAFSSVLALADPGEEELEGGLLIGKHGEGTYVYTGLAFFRQLPVGIPGALRLFANVLGLAENGLGQNGPADNVGRAGERTTGAGKESSG